MLSDMRILLVRFNLLRFTATTLPFASVIRKVLNHPTRKIQRCKNVKMIKHVDAF